MLLLAAEPAGARSAAAIVLAHVVLLLGPPLISQDVFGYLDFARLGALHGLDPYTHVAAEAPTDPAFQFVGLALPALAIRPAVHARELRRRAARPGGRLWALKALAALASLAGIGLVALRPAVCRARAAGPRRSSA